MNIYECAKILAHVFNESTSKKKKENMEMSMKVYENVNDYAFYENLTMLDKTAVDVMPMKNKLLKLMSPNVNEAHSEEKDNELEEE